MKKSIPKAFINYLSTKEFTEGTIPKSLLNRHNTKHGSWGQIIVLEGSLIYRILEPEVQEYTLSPDHCGIIEPQVYHQVESCGPVRFRVDFYKNV